MGKGNKNNNLLVKFLALFCCLISPQLILAGAADLDTTFDGDGKVVVDFMGGNDLCLQIVLQPDGKIIAVGRAISTGTTEDFALARFNSNGSLDPFFGSSGRVRTDFNGTTDRGWSVALQTDGKIVASGTTFVGTSYDFSLARYTSDGDLDFTFGTNGKMTTDFSGGTDEARSIAIQPDGKIVAAGIMTNSAGDLDFALARFHPDGGLDTSFGVGGKVNTDLSGSGNDDAHEMVLQSDGKIIVVGRRYTGTGFADIAIARYNPDGSLDTSFSGDGIIILDLFSAGADDDAYGIALQTDGKILVAGTTKPASSYDFAVLRFTPEGELDTTFSFDGIVVTDFTNGLDQAASVAVQADGKILVAGYAFSGTNGFALARYSSDGTPDNDFGTGGRVITYLGESDSAQSIVLQSDGKIVAGGNASDNLNFQFALARYLGDPPPPPPPTCLYCDDFQDSVLASNWNYVKPTWNEAAGNLVGIPSTRKAEAIASPAFAGCSVCSVEASMSTMGGVFGKLWLLGWHIDKKNTVEVLMKEQNDKWVLKQRSGGRIVAKTKGLATILPNTFYNVKVNFDGINFSLIVDGVTIAVMPAAIVPTGTVGFRVKGTTGSFGSIEVN